MGVDEEPSHRISVYLFIFLVYVCNCSAIGVMFPSVCVVSSIYYISVFVPYWLYLAVPRILDSGARS